MIEHFSQDNTTGYSDAQLDRMNAVMTTRLLSEGLPPTEEECAETGDSDEYKAIGEMICKTMDQRIADGRE